MVSLYTGLFLFFQPIETSYTTRTRSKVSPVYLKDIHSIAKAVVNNHIVGNALCVFVFLCVCLCVCVCVCQ